MYRMNRIGESQDRGKQSGAGQNMDVQDGQDKEKAPEGKLKHGDITRAVIGCAFAVMKELGAGFLESVYEQAMLLALREKGLSAAAQQPIQVFFRGRPVGDFYADILVEGKVVVELKTVRELAPEHEAQVINYLNATGLEVGLLINFGKPRLEYRRFTRGKEFEHG